MGMVPLHPYLLTGDKRYREDFEKEQRFWGRLYLVTVIILGAALLSLPFILN